MAPISGLQITIGTGDDDLRSDSTAEAYIHVTTGGNQQEYSTMLHNEGDPGWGNNTIHGPISWILPGGVTTQNLALFGIRMQSHSGGFESPDNWNMNTILVTYPDSMGDQAILIEQAGGPIFRFTEHESDWSTQPN